MNKVTRKAEKSNNLPHSLIMNNKEVSIVKTAEAFNNHFLNMVDDLQIQIDNDTSPISLKKILIKRFFTDEYNSCNRRRDTKYNMFLKSKRFRCV